MKLKQESWGTFHGTPVHKFTVSDPHTGSYVTVTDLGASLLQVVRPDKHGKLIDIALTQNSAEELISRGGSLGATVGRVANRIGYGRFELDGNVYQLAINNGPHHLHGGPEGFYKKIWHVTEHQESENEVRLGFKYESHDNEEGYPGTLITNITYHFEANKISWVIESTTDRATVVNITNHAYWNLEGLGVSVDNQEIEIAASTYFPGDENSFPLGEVRVVEPSLDMRTHRKFSDVFQKFGDVDNNFFLDEAKGVTKNKREVHYCARAFSEKTGISMVIHTSEPGVQLYTGNFLDQVGTVNGGHAVNKHYAFCLETQRAPNAINYPQFRDSVILRPEEVYYHKTVHEFRML